MSTAVPIAVLRAVAWVVLVLMTGYGLFLLARAFVEMGSGAVGSFFAVVVLAASVPFIIGGILSWAFIMAFAGGVEAVVQLRDMKRDEIEYAEYLEDDDQQDYE